MMTVHKFISLDLVLSGQEYMISDTQIYYNYYHFSRNEY